DEALIRSQLAGVENMPEEVVLEKTSRVLSLISNNLGVVVSEPISSTILEHIHFMRLSERRVLVVLVSRVSLVRDQIIRLESDITQQELDRASNYLNDHFRGWALEEIRVELVKRLDAERIEYDSLLRDLQQLCAQGMLEEDFSAEVFLEG